jgi:hypothetical protein
VDFPLTTYAEGLSQACTAHFQFEVFLVAVQSAFDETAQYQPYLAQICPQSIFVNLFNN